MAKLTRNSYKRKVILFGVLIFVSIALISTGFAAWVMSTNAKANSNPGNISVGTVNDAKLTISEINITGDKILFEPAQGDDSGRVRQSDESLYAQLTSTITGSVTPQNYLGQLTAHLVVTQGVYDELMKVGTPNETIILEKADGTAMTKAELEQFLVVGTVSEDGTTITGNPTTQTGIELYSQTSTGSGNFTSVVADNAVNFTIKINFNWGAAFGNMNPSQYFDEDAAGLAVSDEQVKKALEDFRAALYGYANEAAYTGSDAEARANLINTWENTASRKILFQVIISAKAN